MSLRELRIYGDPVLGSRAEEISKFDAGLRALASDMLGTMDKAGGVGLAANQVGILQRIFVYDCSHTQSGLRGAMRKLLGRQPAPNSTARLSSAPRGWSSKLRCTA